MTYYLLKLELASTCSKVNLTTLEKSRMVMLIDDDL